MISIRNGSKSPGGNWRDWVNGKGHPGGSHSHSDPGSYSYSYPRRSITHWVSDHFGTLSRNCRLLLKSGRGLIGLIPQYSSGDDIRTLSSEYISSGE